LRKPEIGEKAAEWTCNHCGRVYRAVLLEDWPAEYRRSVSLKDGPSLGPSPSDEPGWWQAEFDVPPPDPISIAFPDHLGVRCELETPASCELDTQVGQEASLRLEPQGDPFASTIRQHGAAVYDQQAVGRFREMLCLSSRHLGQLFGSLNAGDAASLDGAETISRDALFRIAEDKDLFAGLSLTAPSNGYPSRHGLRVAMLAMCVGTAMGLEEQTLRNLGIGCMVHDVGMLDVDQGLYDGKRLLTAADFKEITKHPLSTVGTLQGHADLPPSARIVAYQIHERCNGAGYPRGYKSDQIHDLAKIAAVADAFVAMVSPRPHRPGMVPYHALKKILKDTNRGLYDADAVRGLLEAVSAFPIGSFVSLADGRVGRVIRPSPERYDRPIIEAWDRADLTAPPVVVDLLRDDGATITGSLPRLE